MKEINTNKPLQIAIDGTVGSGKGTLAVALSKIVKATHIYTGGMYRALALACKRSGVDLDNVLQVMEVLNKSEIDLRVEDDSPLTRVFLNGEDVSEEIFFPQISNITPIVAAFEPVRKEMVERQKKIIEGKRGIIEGRDIATHVVPNADIKIYLTASVEVRARRRLDQLKAKHVDITLEDVIKDIEARDKADASREASPMEISEDSFVVDTSNDTVDDTVGKVMNELEKRGLL